MIWDIGYWSHHYDMGYRLLVPSLWMVPSLWYGIYTGPIGYVYFLGSERRLPVCFFAISPATLIYKIYIVNETRFLFSKPIFTPIQASILPFLKFISEPFACLRFPISGYKHSMAIFFLNHYNKFEINWSDTHPWLNTAWNIIWEK